MAYIGANWPDLQAPGRMVETFTVNAGAGPYTLARRVVGGDPADIEVFIDNVRQQPTTAYTIGGTGNNIEKQITFTAAPTNGIAFYVVHVGPPVWELAPAESSVTNTKLATSSITGHTAETTVADDDVILMYDTSASALRKITRANFKSVEVATTLNNVGDVTITSNSSGELIKWNGSAWINNTLAEAGIAPVASPTLTGDVTLTGAAANAVWDASDNALEFADNAKATFGASADLSIYHDGSHSYITDSGTGSLIIKGTDLYLQDASGNRFAFGTAGGTCELYHNASAKISTSATGATITGTLVATTNTDTSNSGSVTLDFAANQNFVLTLTGNVTLANPSTEQVGQSGIICCIQDGTGSRTLSLGTDYETAGGAGITLSTAANAVDIIPYFVKASGSIQLGAVQLAFS